MNQKKPNIIQFDPIGVEGEGVLSVAEFAKSMPYPIKRVFWVHHANNAIKRGNHAHYENKTIAICLHGTVEFRLDDLKNNVFHYKLDSPSQGLLIPVLHWHEITMSKDAILLCLCSEKHIESDYLRDFKEFSRLKYEKKNSIV